MGKGAGDKCDRKAIDLFGLSDLHLGPGVGKSHYSSSWRDHQPRMRKNWDERITQGSLVLMPGDFSWNDEAEDMRYDFLWIDDRPGHKVVSPGNHDYGEVWEGQENLDNFLSKFSSMEGVMNRAIRLPNPFNPKGPGMVIAAAQGTQAPRDKYFNTNKGYSSHGKEAESVRFLQELLALDDALKHAKEIKKPGDELVVMIHYPPFANGKYETVYSKLIERAGARLCLYGHLHQKDQWRATFQGERGGCEYRFVGADFLNFKPTKLGEWTPEGLKITELEVDASKAWPDDKDKDKDKKKDKDKDKHKNKGDKDKNKDRKVRIIDEAPAKCVACQSPIFDDEPYHRILNGELIHGGGSQTDFDTCRKARK